MELNAGGDLLEKSLDRLNLSNRFGVQVVLIVRGKVTIFPVSASNIVMPGDRLVLVGPSESLHQVAKLAEK
ncbi:cation:proton antiporter regulatory subunit [Alicyclobacillus sp. SO9]|uniref:cation:proton antiporter regulatory subunit n=1 Tax=Alicyclobacillus sp. SO9 TaxID=2665646 RepID=UPI00351C311A